MIITFVFGLSSIILIYSFIPSFRSGSLPLATVVASPLNTSGLKNLKDWYYKGRPLYLGIIKIPLSPFTHTWCTLTSLSLKMAESTLQYADKVLGLGFHTISSTSKVVDIG